MKLIILSHLPTPSSLSGLIHASPSYHRVYTRNHLPLWSRLAHTALSKYRIALSSAITAVRAPPPDSNSSEAQHWVPRLDYHSLVDTNELRPTVEDYVAIMKALEKITRRIGCARVESVYALTFGEEMVARMYGTCLNAHGAGEGEFDNVIAKYVEQFW